MRVPAVKAGRYSAKANETLTLTNLPYFKVGKRALVNPLEQSSLQTFANSGAPARGDGVARRPCRALPRGLACGLDFSTRDSCTTVVLDRSRK